MSHFTVLVVGEGWEQQLIPYKEAGWGDDDPPELESALVSVLDSETNEFYRYNPNAKWDWYLMGGRWTGFFKLKSGSVPHTVGEPGIMTEPADPSCADQARKGDIDFAAMQGAASRKRRRQYLAVAELCGGSVPTLRPWTEIVEYKHISIDAKRALYWNQLGVVAWRRVLQNNPNNGDLPYQLDDLQKPLHILQREARHTAVTTFAVLMDGRWYERGSMGWWGIVSGGEEFTTWATKVSELLDSLSDDTLLTVVDCHI